MTSTSNSGSEEKREDGFDGGDVGGWAAPWRSKRNLFHCSLVTAVFFVIVNDECPS